MYKLEDIKEEEIKFSKSLIGPHLDNFELNLNSKNLKFFSSGEKKINLLLVYISFIELFKKIKDDCPVFLVDDFDTAMDKKNIDILMKNYPEIQVIATSVNGNDKFDHFVELKREN